VHPDSSLVLCLVAPIGSPPSCQIFQGLEPLKAGSRYVRLCVPLEFPVTVVWGKNLLPRCSKTTGAMTVIAYLRQYMVACCRVFSDVGASHGRPIPQQRHSALRLITTNFVVVSAWLSVRRLADRVVRDVNNHRVDGPGPLGMFTVLFLTTGGSR
jgi:hypothetical protein